MSNLLSTRNPRSFSARLLSSCLNPNMYQCLHRCRTLHCPLLKFMKFLSAHFSNLSRSPCMVPQKPGLSSTPPSFVSPVDLFRVHSFHPLMKMLLNNIGPCIDPWAIPLVTGLQLVCHQSQPFEPGSSASFQSLSLSSYLVHTLSVFLWDVMGDISSVIQDHCIMMFPHQENSSVPSR